MTPAEKLDLYRVHKADYVTPRKPVLLDIGPTMYLAISGKGEECRNVKLQRIVEGQCVQMLHVRPYEQEAQTVQVVHDFASQKGLSFHGLHHEIYFSDPRRIAPERFRTILRHPVK